MEEEEKERLEGIELAINWFYDLLQCMPPFPPIPRGLGRAIFGRKFEQRFWKGAGIPFRTPPFQE